MITSEPLELRQRYEPHLKALLCGINASSFQWSGCIFISCYTHLNLALLLHKTVFVTFLLGSTVCINGSAIHLPGFNITVFSVVFNNLFFSITDGGEFKAGRLVLTSCMMSLTLIPFWVFITVSEAILFKCKFFLNNGRRLTAHISNF